MRAEHRLVKFEAPPVAVLARMRALVFRTIAKASSAIALIF